MFFGNMQSFYRRNTIHNKSTSHGSQSKAFKEHVKRVKHFDKSENGDEDEDDRFRQRIPVRRKSFTISREEDYEEPANDLNRINVPVIKIEFHEPESPKTSFNILKEKEKALWFNSCVESDNSVRLGPNKNNIIEESLESDKKIHKNA